MIEMTCFNCGRPLRIADQAAGRRIRCPQCQTLLQVPAATAPNPELPGENDILDALRQAAENEDSASPKQRLNDDLPVSSAEMPQQPTPLRLNTSARSDGFDVDGKERLDEPLPSYANVELAPRKRQFRRKVILLSVIFGAALLICIAIAIRFTSHAGRSESVNVGANHETTSGASFARHLPPMPDELRAYADSLIADKHIQVELNLAADPIIPAFFSPIAQHEVALSAIHVTDGQGQQWNSANFGLESLKIIESKLFAILKRRGLMPYDPRRETATEKPLQRLIVTLRVAPVFQNFIVRQRMDITAPAPKPAYSFRDRFHPSPGDSLNGDRWVIGSSASAGDAEPLLSGLSICIESAHLDVQNDSFSLGGDSMPACRTAIPKLLAEVDLSGKPATGDSPIAISGKIEFLDLDLAAPANETAEILASLIGNPSLAWSLLWSDTPMEAVGLAAEIRFIFAMSGSNCVADMLAQNPDCLPPDRLSALTAVLESPDCRLEWLRPFVKTPEPIHTIAVQQLARKNDPHSTDLFRQCLSQPEGRSPELLEASACALINLKQNCPELSAAVKAGKIKSFTNVTNPARALNLDPESARIVVSSLFERGSATQRASAAAVLCAFGDSSDAAALDCLDDIDAPDSQLAQAVCSALAEIDIAPRFELFSLLAGRFLQSGRAGDVPMTVEAVEPAGLLKVTQRYPDTIAGFLCRRLIQSDSQRATPVLLAISTGAANCARISAIEALLAGDCVDAAPALRERFRALTERETLSNPIERQELEILRSKEFTRFCRYEVQLASIKNLIVNGRASEARQMAKTIADEKPGTEVAARALQLIAALGPN